MWTMDETEAINASEHNISSGYPFDIFIGYDSPKIKYIRRI